MHGCCSTSVLVVNAEVYSMGGVVEGRVGTANITSWLLAAIQKVQAELRQEYDVREQRKRELEFLEEGGNPLDFKLGNTASVSVQSTSYTDQHLAKVAASEAKGSFALTTSTHDDSVESSGDRKSLRPSRNNIVPSKQSSQMDGGYKALELEDSATFGIPRKSYKRRYRSRPNRDVTRPSSTDVNSTHGSYAFSLLSGLGSRDVKRLKSDAEDVQQDMKLESVKAVGSTRDLNDGASVDTSSDNIASGNPMDELLNEQSLSGAANTHFQLDSDGPVSIQTVNEMDSAGFQRQPGFTASKAEKRVNFCQMNGFSSSIDGTNNDMCTKMGNVESNGNTTNQTLVPDNSRIIEGGDFIKDKKGTEGTARTLVSESMTTGHHLLQIGSEPYPDKQIDLSGSSLNTGMKDNNTIEGMKNCGPSGSESNRVHTDLLGQNPAPQNETCCDVVTHQDSTDTRILDFSEARSLTGVSTVSIEAQTSKFEPKMTNIVDEDSILKEAQIIEAKRKRIMELSMMTSHMEIHRKSQWDYMLEEMAWLANDFAQERIWKISAASQICHRVAFTCRLRKQEQFSSMAMKKVAHSLAKAVMEFWHSVEEKCKEVEQQNQKDGTVSVQAYAVRFLKYINSNINHDQAEMPLTPDIISDVGIMDLSREASLTEEDLFYSIPPGAMETYRKSIESHVAMFERIGDSAQEKLETSPNDVVTDFRYYEDEGETSTHDMSLAVESSKSLRFGQKKRKYLKHAFGPRSNEIGSNLLPIRSAEHKLLAQQPLLVKQPGISLNVSVPTRRVRTASRRVISPFSAGESGCIQFPNKTDASSGDSDSFPDDQSTLRGGSLVPNTFDTESVGEFENQLSFDSAEVTTKPKKKKAKHMHVAYEQRWQANSGFQHDQRDHFKRRTENHQLESNGSSGLFGHPVIKKPKIMRQSHDNSYNNLTPTSVSVPSPVASQMSNMSHPNKFIKMLGGRDRGRKPKAQKVPAGQPCSGSAWSKFEEQALVVLVHDLGPNWELISDAFSCTFHFKCVFRKAEECKERHRLLVDRTSGDGADSAEDSGSSQPYPSTLPGIPKGSARQLFLRLQEPIEEETLKSHFEKIIMISQKKHCRKAQDPKQLQQPHSSHIMALSQVFPNNLNGGPILTPLDLCDSTMAGPDILPLGFQGPHSSGLAIPSQTAVNQILPHSSANPVLQGSQNMLLGNNVSSSPGPLSSSASRDGKYVVPRSASLSADEQQRVHQYNYMVSNRDVPQSNISAPGGLSGVDRGIRIRPGNNGMSMVVNRSMPIARPVLQGFGSSSMVNSGRGVSPVMTPATMHTGVGSGQGSSMPRPRETSHMMRLALNQDSPRKIMGPDQMPGNNQGVSHFGGLNSSTPNNHTGSPSYAVHQPARPLSPQQPQGLGPHNPHFQGPGDRVPTPQQQAYAIRLAKERQLQNRFLPPQQLASSNSLMQPNVQTQPQVPVSSPLQNNAQIHVPTSSQVSLSPSTLSSSMAQQKHPTPTQSVKQRQKQQQQLLQSNRQHPQQGKLSKGVGKGNLTLNQNIPIDSSLSNGLSVNPLNQSLARGEPENLVQGQGLYTGSVQQAVQPKRRSLNCTPASSSLKRPHEITSRSDNNSQGHNIPSAVPPGVSAGHQSIPSVATVGSSHQQALSHQKSTNQNKSTIQRVVTPNRQMSSDPSHKPEATESNADQQLASSSAKMDTEPTLPQASTNATNAVRVVSPAKTHQLQPPDALLDSNALYSAANLNSSVSAPSNSSVSVPHVGQGPILHSHQQAQLLQVGNGDLYGRPSDPGLE